MIIKYWISNRCIYFKEWLINGGKTLWELINFNQISDLNNVANSTAYKIGYVVGMLVEIIVFFGLIKIIYAKFFKEVKTKENALN